MNMSPLCFIHPIRQLCTFSSTCFNMYLIPEFSEGCYIFRGNRNSSLVSGGFFGNCEYHGQKSKL